MAYLNNYPDLEVGNLLVYSNGNINFTTTANTALGNVANIHILGGTAYAAVVSGVTAYANGELDTISLSNVGLGYDIAPTVTVTGSNTGAAVVTATLAANGSISGFNYTNRGAGYSNVDIDATISSPTTKYLKTDGAGNLAWSEVSGTGGGGSGTPGGSNTQIQYNDSGQFNGNPALVFDETTGATTFANVLSVSGDSGGNVSNVGEAYITSTATADFIISAAANSDITVRAANGVAIVASNGVSGQVNLNYLNSTVASNVVVAANVITLSAQANTGNAGLELATLTLNAVGQSNLISSANIVISSGANTAETANTASITVNGAANTVTIGANANSTLVVTDVGANVTGNLLVTANLTVNGNLTYINVDTLAVEDPIIELGGGPNGNALTSDDGKDRGTLLHYYTTEVIDAFMGWDNSNGEFAFGSNVTVANDVVTFSNLGNVRGSTFIGGLNANGANIVSNSTVAFTGANLAVGRVYLNTTTISNSSYTVANTDQLVLISTAGNVTITLPAAAANTVGRHIIVKDIAGNDRVGNNITIQTAGSDTLDGTANYLIRAAFNSVNIVGTGSTSWGII